jgi:endonuclease/exonuclease/phosphatase family metal-dependent hydrolase
VSNAVFAPVAALLIAVPALRSSLARSVAPLVGRAAWLAVLLVIPLLALPAVQINSWSTPRAVSEEGFPVRVATYNLHNGFDTEGRLGMEAIASVIEEIDPDIVALQEVSRGWVISGRLDMLTWLSERLEMPHVFGPTADPFWGNAILSRYPILEYAEYDLPPRDLPVKRGLIAATVDLGQGETLQVIATHYHHVEGDSDIRQAQARTTAEVWDGQDRTVLLGDLNAEPDDPEMAILRRAGLVDPVEDIEPPPKYTWPADHPTVRIDYIWTSPDLTTDNPHVISTTASDHMPVAGEIAP